MTHEYQDESGGLTASVEDMVLFGKDWNIQMQENFMVVQAAKAAMKVIASNPTLRAAEKHARQAQAIEVHSSAMRDALEAAAFVLVARERAVELFIS